MDASPPSPVPGDPGLAGSGSEVSRRTSWVLLTAFSAIALCLRLPYLGRSELWVDEAATWWFGLMTTKGGLFEMLLLEPTPPLYYSISGVMLRLFGDSEVALRFPSVVFGTLSVLATYLLSTELFGRRVGLWSSAILAVHPLHVFYSREARVYSLLTLILPLVLWLAIRTARGGRRTHAFGLFVGLVLLCYSHMYALFAVPLVVCVGGLFLPHDRLRQNLRMLLLPVLGAAVLWLPYLIQTVPRLSGSGAAWSVGAFYDQNPEQRNILRSFAQLLLGANYHGDLRGLAVRTVAQWLWLPAMVLQGFLISLAVTRSLRLEKGRELLALSFAWPLLIVPPWALTLLGRPMFLSGRHDALCLGFVSCWLALGIVELLERRRAAARLARRRLGALRWCTVPSLLLLALLVVQRLTWIYIESPGTYHRTSASTLVESARPGDVVVATGIRRLVTQYYTSRGLRTKGLKAELWERGGPPSGSGVNFVSFPRSTDLHPGWSDALALSEDEAVLAREGTALVETLQVHSTSSDSSVWTLERAYPEADGAISVSYLVDRHLEAALKAAGYTVKVEVTESNIRGWSP